MVEYCQDSNFLINHKNIFEIGGKLKTNKEYKK